MRIGVVCTHSPDGMVQVRKVQWGERWLMVQQGRQWQDDNGRHVLIMLPTQETWEIVQRSDTLVWERIVGHDLDFLRG